MPFGDWLIAFFILIILLGAIIPKSLPKSLSESFLGEKPTISPLAIQDQLVNSDCGGDVPPVYVQGGHWGSPPCQQDPLGCLYKYWGNGGIDQGNYPEENPEPNGSPLRTYYIPPYYPPASVKDPHNTLVDQYICQDYAKRTCLGTFGEDLYASCQSGQYDSCMDGRKRLIWQASITDPHRDYYPAVDS
jgi:hypothetical protein